MPLFKKKENRKKFIDTKVGQFLKDKGAVALDVLDDFIPPLKIVTAMIQNNDKLTEEDKKQALEFAEMDLKFEQNITDRWKSDNESGNWLSQNARPLVLLSAVLMLYVFIVLDSCNIKFHIKDSWISLYEVVLVTTIAAYFGLRSFDKRNPNKG